MITEYIRYNISNELIDPFLQSYKKASVPLGKSKYCVEFDLTQCTEEKGNFTLRIVWTSKSDHLEKFRQSEEFKDFFLPIKPYLSNIVEMRRYEFTDIRKK